MAEDRKTPQDARDKARADQDTPYLTFLPLMEEGYNPGLRQGAGIVAGGGSQPEKWLEDMARHMVTGGRDVGFAIPDVMAAQQQMRRFLRRREDPEGQEKRTSWRGLMALTLLWDGWEKDATWPLMTVETYDAATSAFASSVLNSRGDKGEKLRIITLSREQDHGPVCLPLCMVSDQTLIVPAADPGSLSALLPDRVSWYDRQEDRFLDPCPYLNESDRTRLIAQLRLLQRMNEQPAWHSALYDPDASLVTVLEQFIRDLGEVRVQGRTALRQGQPEAEDALRVRMLAVCGLMGEEGFDMLTRRTETYAAASLTQNLLIACFAGEELPPLEEDVPRQVTYLWRGVPFARDSAVLGLEATHHAGEEEAVAEIRGELRLMEDGSVRFAAHLRERLAAWLEEKRDSQQLSPEVRALVSGWLEEAGVRADRRIEQVTLRWPWPASSGAARALVRETLGQEAAERMLPPFSDCLTVLSGCMEDALGDTTLCRVCLMPGTETLPQSMAIPPLSANLTRYLCEQPEDAAGRVALAADSFGFEREEGAIVASFTLHGAGTLRLVRRYEEDHQVLIAPEETPTVTVWPSVPFRTGSWKAYYVYAHLEDEETEVWALREGQWTPCDARETSDSQGSRRWQVQRTATFPRALLLMRGGRCLGALLNLLPPFMIQHAESAVVAVDFGTTGTTVVIRQGERVSPMRCPCLQRTLLHGPFAAPLADEFMPTAPITPILFSAEDLFTDDPALWRETLLDGHAYMPLSFGAICRKEAGRLYYDLKWGTEAFRDRVNRLYLSQVMTMACLTALVNGAPDVSWRIAMPGTMAPEGRLGYWQMMNELAQSVSALTGMKLTPGVPPVSHAPESMAAGMYFRSRNEVNVRGGFMTMDVGGGSAELSLWLRGRDKPAASCSLPMGAQFMLLDSLLEKPSRLTDDFSDIDDPDIVKELSQLTAQFAVSRGSRRSLQKCRFMLDAFLGEHLDALSRHMNARYAEGRCTLTQALLLMNFAFLLMLAGQMQEQAWHNPLLNDLMPGYMEMCMSGRGCLLMLGLSDMLKARLKHFIRLTMSQEHPVREHMLVVSGAPKLEVATGLVRMDTLSSQVPAGVEEVPCTGDFPLTPMAVMKRFLSLLRSEFPDAAARLFPDLYAAPAEGLLTRKAELTLQTILDNQFSASPSSLQTAYAACLVALKQSQGL